jgi:RNA polymerase sigma factor (sigma-70 family)
MNYTNINQNLAIYFKEIRNNKSLTKDEETLLFARIQAGDKRAETEVFNRMAKLAVATAKTYTSKAELLEDLIQEANIGILAAIGKFDPDKGYRFSSCARWWMKCAISRFLSEMGLVHSGSPILLAKARRIREEFYALNQREITEYELMDILEEMGEVVTDTTAITEICHIRIDRPVETDEDITIGECGEFADRTASYNDIESDVDDEGLYSEIRRRMFLLSEREQIMVRMKFGIGYDYEMEYPTIAEKWTKLTGKPIGEERVRQIIVGALKKMKKFPVK